MPQPRTDQAMFDAKIAAATEMHFARLAAFVDGEGTIVIGRTKTKNKPNMYNFVLTLIVANTDLRLLAWLSRTFSGENLFRGKGNWGNKPCYSWRLFEKRAAVVITRIMPYLICKREQAEIALAYRE